MALVLDHPILVMFYEQFPQFENNNLQWIDLPKLPYLLNLKYHNNYGNYCTWNKILPWLIYHNYCNWNEHKYEMEIEPTI